MNSWFWKGEKTKDALIIFGCALLNLLLTVLLYPKFASIGTDGVFYALMAESLAEGRGLTAFHQPHIFFSPLFSFTIVPFYLLIGNIDLAAHVTVIILGFLTLPFFYYGMRLFVERHVAGIATLFLAVNATVVWKNFAPVAQPLATFLSVVLFFFLAKYLHFDKQRTKVFAFSFLLGLIAGALYLTRPEYIVLIFPLAVFLFWSNWNTVALKRNIAIVFAALLGFVLCAAPYIIFLHTETGQWTFTGRLFQQVLVAQGLSITGDAAPPASAVSSNSLTPFLQSIFATNFIKVYFSNLYDMEWFLLRVFGIIGFSFFGIGLWKVIAEKRFAILGVLAVTVSMLFAFAMGYTGDHGYVMPYLFIFIFFIGIGCDKFISTLMQSLSLVHWRRLFVSVGLVTFSAAYFALPLLQNFFFMSNESAKPVEYQLLGQWFQESVERPDQQLIVARKPEIAFFAGSDWVEISGKETPEQLFALMKERQASYIAVDTRSMGNAAKDFIEAKDTYPMKILEFVRGFEYGDQRIRLYYLPQ